VHDQANIQQSDENNELGDALGQFRSRDYNSDFYCENEGRLWQSLNNAGTLGQHANSFLILLSNSQKGVENMSEFAFRTFQEPDYDYLKNAESNRESKANGDSSDVEIIDLRNQLAAVSNELALVKGSRGWRLLNVFRRLLGNKLR